MLSWGKTGTVRASATVGPARSQEIYQRYAVALYRQALLNPGHLAPAGHVDCAPVVNECALAAMPERGEDDARYRLAESVFRRSRQLASRLAGRRGLRGTSRFSRAAAASGNRTGRE
jgi:hypothetical protein